MPTCDSPVIAATPSSRLPDRLLRGTERLMTLEHAIYPTSSAQVSLTQRERACGAFLLPPFQRPFVWDLARQRAYVEGTFLGFGTGSYVTVAPDYDSAGAPLEGSYWLLDGQQRITSLSRFVADEFAVFDGLRFSDLTDGERLRWLRTPFPSLEVDLADRPLFAQLYERMNYGGVPHQEGDRSAITTWRDGAR